MAAAAAAAAVASAAAVGWFFLAPTVSAARSLEYLPGNP